MLKNISTIHKKYKIYSHGNFRTPKHLGELHQDRVLGRPEVINVVKQWRDKDANKTWTKLGLPTQPSILHQINLRNNINISQHIWKIQTKNPRKNTRTTKHLRELRQDRVPGTPKVINVAKQKKQCEEPKMPTTSGQNGVSQHSRHGHGISFFHCQ